MKATLQTIFKHVTLAAVAAAILIGTTPTGNAAAFAKYDGVDGEAKDAHHDKWIDVLNIDWGIHRPMTDGTTRRRGAPIVEDMRLTMVYDKASPKLMEKCLRGEIIPKLEFEMTATYGGTRATYLKYELTNVMITSYEVHASGNDEAGPPTVVVGNNFEEIKVTYTEYDDDGAKAGNVEAEWRIETGE
jgi:type VI secretion system secreted protein Hcp